MKPIGEATCCVVDAGCFPDLARAMAQGFGRVLYYSPFEQEYLDIKRCCIGDGADHFERCDEFLDPKVLAGIDLFIFPDIGFAGLERHLESLGKLVWGSRGTTEFELYRTKFCDLLEELGLPRVPSMKIRGVTALAEHLKGVENKWVKINRYRDNMETWHHIDYAHSARELERMAYEFGPLKDRVVFVVQDPIDDEEGSPVIEIGYDGFTIDGDFPPCTYQGYEKKNQLYLGSELAAEDLPEPIRVINDAIAPMLKEHRHRGFIATEIRVKDGVPHYTDPTNRMAGQTMEHLFRTCLNLPEIIYYGAAGEMVEPEFGNQFAVEATLHLHAQGDGWKTMAVPEEVRDYVALYRYCEVDGLYHFPPGKNDEVGVICGGGDTIEEALNDLKEHFELLKGEPVTIELAGFADLVEQIEKAEKEGVEFSDQPLPDPAVAIE